MGKEVVLKHLVTHWHTHSVVGIKEEHKYVHNNCVVP